MSFNNLDLPQDINKVLVVIFNKAKKINPALSEKLFFEGIAREWLEPYSIESSGSVLPKGKVLLRNNLKQAITLSGKSQAQVAKEVGISRAYLTQLIKGVYDPSVLLAILLMQVINYPMEKFKDLFFLEPVVQE